MKDMFKYIDLKADRDDLRHGVEDEYGVLYSEDGEFLLECRNGKLERYTVKKGCKFICEKAFNSVLQEDNLKEIILPEGVVAIGAVAFVNRKKLTRVSLPDSLRYIGNNAFELCKSLRSITLPKGFQSLGTNPFADSGVREVVCLSPDFRFADGCLTEGDRMVSWLSDSRRCAVPEGTRVLGAEAFPTLSVLHEILLPEGLEEIGSNAFQKRDLQKLVIPSTVKKMADNPFAYHCSVRTLEVRTPHFSLRDGFLVSDKGVLVACMGTGPVALVPDGVKEIGAGAFYGNGYVRKVVLPSSLETIGHDAFADCPRLTSVYIPEGVRKIGEGAFSFCQALHEVTLPGGLTLVEDRVLQNTGIREITVPEGVKHIGKAAFCLSQLETVRLPESVESIGDDAFGACPVREVVFPSVDYRLKVRAFPRIMADLLDQCDGLNLEQRWTIKRKTEHL